MASSVESGNIYFISFRYLNHLDSSIIARDLTSSDEEKLFKLHDEMGNKWSVIGKYF